VRRAASRRQKRALFVSSPIGLGHAQRDLALADALRRLVPDLQIDWLAQDPGTSVLERRGDMGAAAARRARRFHTPRYVDAVERLISA